MNISYLFSIFYLIAAVCTINSIMFPIHVGSRSAVSMKKVLWAIDANTNAYGTIV